MKAGRCARHSWPRLAYRSDRDLHSAATVVPGAGPGGLYRRETGLGFLVGEVLHDRHAFGQDLSIVELERGHGTLGIDCEEIGTVLELLGLQIRAFEISGQTRFAQRDVGGERAGTGRKIQLHDLLHSLGRIREAGNLGADTPDDKYLPSGKYGWVILTYR